MRKVNRLMVISIFRFVTGDILETRVAEREGGGTLEFWVGGSTAFLVSDFRDASAGRALPPHAYHLKRHEAAKENFSFGRDLPEPTADLVFRNRSCRCQVMSGPGLLPETVVKMRL